MKAEETELCHYCQNKAKYTDVAETDQDKYEVVGICQCHLVLDVTS